MTFYLYIYIHMCTVHFSCMQLLLQNLIVTGDLSKDPYVLILFVEYGRLHWLFNILQPEFHQQLHTSM